MLSALEPFFNYRALWVEHERANGSFFHVKDRLGFYVTGRKDDELDLDKLARFYDEYEQVWSTLNAAWSRQRLLNDGTGAGEKMTARAGRRAGSATG